MTIRKLLIPFLTEGAGESAFRAGAVIAERFKAHLDVVHMRERLPIPAAAYYPIAGGYIEENSAAVTAAQKQLAHDLKRRFESLCADLSIDILSDSAEHNQSRGPTAAWSDLDASLPYDLGTRARVADMVVLARPGGKTPPYEPSLLEELVFQSGRPVFVVSDEAPITEVPKAVAVAWDGGREAARALGAAMPVLQAAQTVIVMTVGHTRWAAEPPESAAAYLRLHDVHADHLHARLEKGEDDAEAFLRQAGKHGADLIVMGAYSHNRWREVVLGGFTRHMLNRARLPVFIMH